MAIVGTNLLTVGDTAAASPYTTGTVTPATNGDPILVYVAHSASTVRSISSIVGLGLTWSLVKAGAGTSGLKGELWQGIGTASTGTVVITWSSTITGAVVSFVQYAGAHKTVPIVAGQNATAVGNNTTPTVNLPGAITAGNAAVGGVANDVGNPTAGGGFTRFAASYTVPTTAAAQEYDPAPADATVDFTMGSGHWDIVAVELAKSAAETQFVGDIPF